MESAEHKTRIRHYPPRRGARESGDPQMAGRPRSTLDMTARVLVWAALGWTVAMLVVVLFMAEFGPNSQTLFAQHGYLAVVLALVPVAIVSLPLVAFVSKRVRRITPIVAVLTAFLVVGSLAFAGGFFIPAAFALTAAALLEIADSGGTES